ncbi:hypothetical protein AGLY_015523 [Aphis glycines]|uniref:Uncharacterized protein n=1 Tax=Aphis glycines TaxID=307491 RepID=A0A6G0T182_APHGL|nr:hypothetical protein AGLY_015523 [Aphis glycines]
MPKKKNVNVGTVPQPCGNLNESNNGNNTNDEGHEIEPNDTQEGHVNMPNGPNVDVGNVNTNTLLCTLLSQNSMLMEILKSQQAYKSSNEMTIAPDLNKSIPVFNGLATGAQAKDWLRTVNGVTNLHRWPDNFKLQSVRANLDGAARHWFMSRDTITGLILKKRKGLYIWYTRLWLHIVVIYLQDLPPPHPTDRVFCCH